MKRLSFLAELHLFDMSEKALFSVLRRWGAWLYVKRRVALVLLCFLLVVWAVPYGLRSLLVQQLQDALKREVRVQAVQVHPLSLSLSVDGLSVKNAEGGEFVGWQRLTVDVSAQSFTQGVLVLDALTLQSPRVWVTHLGQGRFDFSDLLVSDKPESSAALPPFVLREVSILDGRVSLDDQAFQRTHTLENFNFTLPMFSSVSGNNGVSLLPELSATLNGASLHVSGGVQPLADVPDGALTLTLDALDVSGLQAYVPPTLPMRMVRGKLSADLTLSFSEVAGNKAWRMNGTTQLQDLVLHDEDDRHLLSFKNLDLSLNPSDVLAGQLALSHVMFDNPQADVRIQKDGQLNWAKAFPSQPEQNKPVAGQSAFAMQVDQFTLRGGVVAFVDASVKPVVQTRITDMNAVLNNFSTQPGTQADLSLKANLGAAAPLNLQARLQPLNMTSFLDAKLLAKQVDLTRVSGYAQKYLGYPINQGKLSVEASYRIKDKQLQADNHVLIDRLTLGEQVPSPHAIDAPVSLGVSLLKNSSEQIDIDLPMSGAVDAPEFSLGGLVAQTIGNVLVKVVTAPVRAIGSLVGSDDKKD
jgi:uncharacterized protein involved in outer membrane biogenesis